MILYTFDAYDDESGGYIELEEVFHQYPIFTGHHPYIWEQLSKDIKNHFPFCKQIKLSQSYVAKQFIKDSLGISFLPMVTLRKEQMEGRFNIADFDLFELPTVPVYFIYSNPRSIENKLMAMIRSRYFV